MSPTIVRLILAVLVIVATPFVDFIVYFLIEESSRGVHLRPMTGIWTCTVVTGLYLMVAWLAVWAGLVRWTTRRVLSMIVMSLGLTLLTLMIGALIWSDTPSPYSHNGEVIVVIAFICWSFLWVASSVIIFRETAAERGERLTRLGIHAIACPKCGYNLTGLREARCPECGAVYTLDQLYAALKEQGGGTEGV